MQPFYSGRRHNVIERKIMMTFIKIKTLEKLTTGMIILNMAVLAVLCYNYYLKF